MKTIVGKRLVINFLDTNGGYLVFVLQNSQRLKHLENNVFTQINLRVSSELAILKLLFLKCFKLI